MTPMTPPRCPWAARLAMAAMALLGLCAAGCVERTITITSEPEGALVHLNDEEVGRTPLTVPFRYYGLYDVRLEMEGYQPLWTQARAAPPWWEFMGPDLVAEMTPGAASRLHWRFRLTPTPAEDPARLLDHARQMRAAASRPASD